MTKSETQKYVMELREENERLREENRHIRQTHVTHEVYSYLLEENKKLKEEIEVTRYDNRPQCCIDHDKYFSICDTCEYGDWSEEE